jgi:hypothetical protein
MAKAITSSVCICWNASSCCGFQRARLYPIRQNETNPRILHLLLLLTGVTTLAAFAGLGPFSVVVALGGLMWLAILLVLSLSDFVSPGWFGVPGE